MSETVFIVGQLTRPCDDDPIFDSLPEATTRAIQYSWDDSPYGIWRQCEGEIYPLISIVYQQEVFA